MRLYLKLTMIVAMAVATQWTLNHTRANAQYWWFAARCQIAYMTRDSAMREGLVREAQASTDPGCAMEIGAANARRPSN